MMKNEKRLKNEDECLSLIERRCNGEVYDFSRTEHRNGIMRKVVDSNPTFLIADGIHERLRKQDLVGDAETRCKKHLDFLGHLYEWQEARGRYFVHLLREGEKQKVWTEGIKKGRNIRGLLTQKQSCFVKAMDGSHLVQARASMMTNAACIVEALDGPRTMNSNASSAGSRTPTASPCVAAGRMLRGRPYADPKPLRWQTSYEMKGHERYESHERYEEYRNMNASLLRSPMKAHAGYEEYRNMNVSLLRSPMKAMKAPLLRSPMP